MERGELANALRYNPHLSPHDVAHAVQSVIDMGFDIKTIEPTVLKRAIDLAFKYNITIYDASFLSLAQTENRLLITADYKLAGRVKGFKHIMRLSEF